MLSTTLDLSGITDRIIKLIEKARDDSELWTTKGGKVAPFTIEVSGLMPEEARTKGDCQLTVYLFHLSAEPFTRNMPLITGPGQSGKQRPQPNTRQPLGLTLYYLISAFAKSNFTQEQQAMSIVIKALHEHSVYTFPDPFDPSEGLTITMTLEGEKADEANRRWQSFSTPFRLSAVYRVSVVFLTAQDDPYVEAKPPRSLGLGVGPFPLPFPKGGSLIATASRADVKPSAPKPGDTITYDFSPAVACPGSCFTVFANDLEELTAKRFYLIGSHGSEHEVTGWKKTPARDTASRVTLTLPDSIDTPPAGSPEPGAYIIRAGSSLDSGDEADYRSNGVAIIVTARVDSVPSPWVPDGGVFSFTGAGFVVGSTEALIDTVSLRSVSPESTLGPGEFTVSSTGVSVSFRPPVSMPSGTYTVRVRVSGVEGPPVGRMTLL